MPTISPFDVTVVPSCAVSCADAERDVLADGILVREILLRERLVMTTTTGGAETDSSSAREAGRAQAECRGSLK